MSKRLLWSLAAFILLRPPTATAQEDVVHACIMQEASTWENGGLPVKLPEKKAFGFDHVVSNVQNPRDNNLSSSADSAEGWDVYENGSHVTLAYWSLERYPDIRTSITNPASFGYYPIKYNATYWNVDLSPGSDDSHPESFPNPTIADSGWERPVREAIQAIPNPIGCGTPLTLGKPACAEWENRITTLTRRVAERKRQGHGQAAELAGIFLQGLRECIAESAPDP